MDYEEEFESMTFAMLRDALNVLEQQGMVEVVGISDNGEEMYQITEKGINYYMATTMDFDTWARIGYESGWCSPPMCYIHDGLPVTATEDEELADGNDPCVHIVRLYENADQKKGCEANNAAAVWRAENLGWENDQQSPPPLGER
jgi:hypothetical protein